MQKFGPPTRRPTGRVRTLPQSPAPAAAAAATAASPPPAAAPGLAEYHAPKLWRVLYKAYLIKTMVDLKSDPLRL